jgi:hypothetical protein
MTDKYLSHLTYDPSTGIIRRVSLNRGKGVIGALGWLRPEAEATEAYRNARGGLYL